MSVGGPSTLGLLAVWREGSTSFPPDQGVTIALATIVVPDSRISSGGVRVAVL
jgi:hypothetical protein